MLRVRPFAALRFDGQRIGDRIAPPYDVLDDAGRAALLAQSPHNIVRIDLPFMPPKALGPEEVYRDAAATLRQWVEQGVLKRDAGPALYPYTQSYTHDGQRYDRRGVMALVRLSEFGQGHVVPHEKTYAGPIEDRLQLMRHTQTQLSPIFGLFSDPGATLTDRIHAAAGQAVAQGEIGGVTHTLHRLDDPELVAGICGTLSDRPVYIADGHHRYTTALHLRRELTERHGGELPEAHPANWCLFALVAMQDPGLLILPTHRLIGQLRQFSFAALADRLAGQAALAPVELSPADYLRKRLPGAPDHTFGVYDGATGQLMELRLTRDDVLRATHAGASEAWRKLDVAILQHWLIDQVIAPAFADGEVSRGYTADPDAITQMVKPGGYQVGLLLKSTPLSALEALGRSDELMPQKSTYFYPKLATGMTIAEL